MNLDEMDCCVAADKARLQELMDRQAGAKKFGMKLPQKQLAEIEMLESSIAAASESARCK